MNDKQHPIEGLMKTAMESLKTMVDVNTILGDPVETPDGAVIVPVSRVSFGFAAGGSEFSGANPKNTEAEHPWGKWSGNRPQSCGLLGGWSGECPSLTCQPKRHL